MNQIAQLAVTLCVGLLAVQYIARRRRSPNLPPGPSGLPIAGNIFDLPRSHEWLTFAKWSNRWGSVISIKIFGNPLIIINSYSDAVELLEKRSTLYSDRPRLIMAGELMGWDRVLQLIPYGDRFRSFRKHLAQSIGSRTHVQRSHELIEDGTKRFLQRILDEPDMLAMHIRRTVRATILKMSHGYNVKEREEDDPIVAAVQKALPDFPESSAPATYLVDIFPILQYLPSWFPGAGFKRDAKVWRKDIDGMADVPFEFVKQQMKDGIAISSFTSRLLENDHTKPEDEGVIKWAAASLLSGGSDTTVSAIHSFFLAMTMYPDAQRKAQEEIDRVVGGDRLPSLADREQLPYVEALVKEIYRFNPVGPLGLPHRVIKDDIYQGRLIPEGAMVIANLWNMLHDPDTYSNPMEFNPSRFLESETAAPEKDPKDICFGFGRRICPGLYLADASIFVTCAMTLAAFNITKAVVDGKVVEPTMEYTSGAISQPKPFQCSIKPRTSKSRVLVQENDSLNDYQML